MSRKVIEWVFEVKGTAAADAERLADSIDHVRTSAKDADRSLDDIKRGSAAVFGGMVGDVEDVGRGLMALGGSAGVAAAGVAGTGLAIGALAVGAFKGAEAIHSLIEGSDALIERLAEIDGAAGISPEATAALDRYRQASLGAEVASAELQVQVAALAAEAFEPAMAGLSAFLRGLLELLPAAESVTAEIEAMQLVARVAMGVMTLGASEAVRYGLGLDEVTAAAREANAVFLDQAAALEEVARGMEAASAFADIQTAAMVAMTGASGAQVRLAQEMEEIDRVTAEYVATLDTADAAERALAEAAYQSAEIRKGQLAATQAEAEAKAAAAEASRLSAAAMREESAATAQAAKDMAWLVSLLDEGVRMRTSFTEHAQSQADAVRSSLDAALPTEGLAEAFAAIDAPTNAQIDARISQAEKTLKSDIASATADKVAGMGDALQGGLTGILSALGPYGSIAATIIEILPQASELLGAVMDQALGFVSDLPQMLDTLLSEGIPTFIGNIDDLVLGIVDSLDEIVVAIVGSLDDLLIAVVKLPIELIRGLLGMLADLGTVIMDALLGAFASLWDTIKEFFRTIFSGDKTKKTGTNLADGRFFGADISPNDEGWFGAFKSFDVGGVITKTGMAQVHAGEMIGTPEKLAQAMGRNPGAGQVVVNVGTVVGNTDEAVRQIAEGLRRQLGGFGSGASIDPYGGG